MYEQALTQGVIMTDPMIPGFVRISKLVWETEHVYTIYISPNEEMDGKFNFKPGQFNMLYVFGVGEIAISISSSPFKTKTLKHTIHNVGTVTSALTKYKKGDYLGIRGPFGSIWPVDSAMGKDVCILAGGIGLAPLRPVIYTLFKNRKDYGKIFILYGARTPQDLLYRVELEQWSKFYNTEVHVTVDHGDQSWKGNIGVVSNLLSYVELDKKNTVSMVCGPEMMMKFTVEDLLEKGIPAENIYLSLERNMKCAIGFCGHCQLGPKFICKDGPVFTYPVISNLFVQKEI
jgi:NAD(P)H-flavin reductase